MPARPLTVKGGRVIAGPSTYTVQEVPSEQWPSLLKQFPSHSVFHTLPWFAAIEAEHGANIQLAKAQNSKGEAVAVWPVFTTRKGPLRIQGSPVPGWNTAYLGPLFRDGCNRFAALGAFLRNDLFNQGSYLSCKVYNDEPDVDMTAFGFVEVEKLDTYCIDLTQPNEKLWDNLKGECRTRVRKARKLGLTVRFEEDGSFLDEFWEMSNETFAICGIKPTFSRSFMEAMWNSLHAAGRIRAMSAMQDGKRLGTLLLPFDDHTMYYWAGGSFVKYRGIPAHNLLHWEAVTHAQELGLQCYDFVSTAGNAGRFKRTFGPQEVHIATTWERAPSWIVRALKSGYQMYRERTQRVSA